MAKYKNLIDIGNLNIDNNTLTIDCVNNRVGVGEVNPTLSLHVNSGAGNQVATFESSDVDAYINIKDSAGNATIGTRSGDMTFYIDDAFTEAMRIKNDTSVGIGTTAVASGYKLTTSGSVFVNAGGGTGITINGAAGGNRILRFHTGDISSNSIRWGLAANGTTESGLDAGSDFGIYRYDDAGSYISEALTIKRSTGNVGLNCATPPASLSINAGNRPDQDAVYIVGTPDDGKSILCIRSNHTSGATKRLIHVTRSGKEGLFVVNNSEAVGIGTTEPSKKLEISNARSETNFSTNANVFFSLENDNTTVNNFASMQFHDGSGLGSAYIGTRFLRTNKGGDLFFATRYDATGSAAIRMTINDAGLVGIANENPSYTLDVTGNINFTGNLTLNGSVYGGASGFWTSNVNDIYYTAGGIAIGTSTPTAAKLTIVNNTSTAYANVAPNISDFGLVISNNVNHVSGGVFSGLQFNQTGNSQNRITYIGAITEDTNQHSSLVFGTDSGGSGRTEKMRINSAGNVGVGTNNIVDHASFSRALVVNGPSGGAIYVKDNDSSTDVGVFGQTNTCTYIENLAVGPIRFYICNGSDFSERMRITSSGTLAVGTETPSAHALLKADFAGDLLLSTGTTSTLYLQDTTNWLQLISGDMRFGLSSDEKMRITNGGNVGINNSSPSTNAVIHAVGTSFTGASGAIILEDKRADANPYIAIENDARVYQLQTVGARDDNFEILDSTAGSVRLAVTSTGDVGIGSTNPTSKLYVSGNIYGENLLSRNTYINKSYSSDYNFSLYPELADGNIRPEVLEYSSANSANVTYGNTNESDAPYAEYFATDGNLTLCGAKIPVCAGESVYGEVWVKRASGATGTAGDLYFGVVREDKDCNPISTNAGIIYFVSAETIPTDGVWHKYSGNLTLPTSHTPFNGSDGGPVRYIEPHLLVNYSAGTIPTCVSNIIVRKTNINSDSGPANILGNVGIGTESPLLKLHIQGDVAGGSYNQISGQVVISGDTNTNKRLNIGFDTSTDKGFLQAGINGTGYNDLLLNPNGGNVGIGVTGPSRALHIKSSNETTFAVPSTIMIEGTDSYNSGTAGAGIIFLGKYDSLSNATTFGVIGAVKENTVDANYGGALVFHTRINGGLGDERLRINSAGNVGINETNPVTQLHVSSYAGIGKIRLEDDAGRTVEIQSPSSGADNGRIGTITNHDFEIHAGNGNGTNFIRFLTDNDEKMRITNAGFVGINMVEPPRQLSVLGEGNATVATIITPSTNGGNFGILDLKRQDNAVNSSIGVRFSHGNSADVTNDIEYGFIGGGIEVCTAGSEKGFLNFAVGPARTEYMRITGDGDVSIGGNTTPLARLHVADEYSSDSDIAYFENTHSDGGAFLTIKQYETTAQPVRSAAIRLGTKGSIIWYQGILRRGGSDHFNTWSLNTTNDNNTSEAKFAVTTGGNVGIGETRPPSLLTLKGGNILLEHNSTGADDGHGIFFHTTTNSWSEAAAHAAIYGKRVDASNGYLRFDTRSGGTTAEKMRVTSAGNLSVNEAYNTAFTNTSGTARYIGVASNNNDALFIAHSSGQGVGYFGYDYSADRLIIATDNGAGGNSIQFSVNAGTTSNGTGDNLAAATAAMIILANENVGIGTDAPSFRLTVHGSSGSDGDFNGYNGTTTGTFRPNGFLPDLMVCRPYTGFSGGGNTLRGHMAFGDGVGIYSVNPNTGGSSLYGDIRFYTSVYGSGSSYCAIDRMTITCGGEVCAHKTIVTPKLEVNGDIYQNGDTFYETNSFTPTIVASTSNPTVGYSVQYGRYTRIGNLVTVQIKIDISSISGGSGQLRIGGLPFTSNTDANYRSAGISSFTRGFNNGGGAITLNIGPNTTEAGLYRWTDSSNFDTELAPADISSVPATIHASLTYEANSWT